MLVDRVVKSPDVCPAQAMAQYLQVRPELPGALFRHFNGSCFSRYQFQAVLKKAAAHLGWETAGFSSHSFRIGVATTAALSGLSTEQIMQKGRWKFQSVDKYVRPNRV